jgi:hypothetical protein
MCSICRPVLRNLSLPHEAEHCPLKKTLWCEFCATRGHTPWTCPHRLEREKQIHFTTFDRTHAHPERDKLYKKAIFYMPKTERACKAILKGFGESYATDFEVTKERLRKKLRSLKYEIIE